MRALAYALAGCLVIFAVPEANADDCPDDPCLQDVIDMLDDYPYCTWFGYSLDPPGYDLDPDCLVPPT